MKEFTVYLLVDGEPFTFTSNFKYDNDPGRIHKEIVEFIKDDEAIIKSKSTVIFLFQCSHKYSTKNHEYLVWCRTNFIKKIKDSDILFIKNVIKESFSKKDYDLLLLSIEEFIFESTKIYDKLRIQYNFL